MRALACAIAQPPPSSRLRRQDSSLTRLNCSNRAEAAQRTRATTRASRHPAAAQPIAVIDAASRETATLRTSEPYLESPVRGFSQGSEPASRTAGARDAASPAQAQAQAHAASGGALNVAPTAPVVQRRSARLAAAAETGAKVGAKAGARKGVKKAAKMAGAKMARAKAAGAKTAAKRAGVRASSASSDMQSTAARGFFASCSPNSQARLHRCKRGASTLPVCKSPTGSRAAFRDDGRSKRARSNTADDQSSATAGLGGEGDTKMWSQVEASEPALAHHIASFLCPQDAIALASSSHRLLRMLRNHPLRLDLITGDFDLAALERCLGLSEPLGEGSHARLSRWSVAGVRLRSAADLAVWPLLRPASLRSLVILGGTAALDFRPIMACRDLETFDAGIVCRSVANLDSIRQLTGLRNLYLRSAMNVTSANFLRRPCSSVLEEVSLYMCANLTCVEGLRHSRSLRVVDLGGCTRLSSITSLSTCFALEKVSLADCAALTDISPICSPEHTQLHHLDLTGCSGLTDLTPLVGVASLASLSLVRTKASAAVPLIVVQDPVVRNASTAAVKHGGRAEAELVVPQLVTILNDAAMDDYGSCEQQELARTSTLDVLCHLCGVPDSEGSPYLDFALATAVFGLASDSDRSHLVRKRSFEIISRLCHTTTMLQELVDRGIAVAALSAISALLPATREHADVSCPIAAATVEHCASVLLLIAASPVERDRLVEAHPEVIGLLVAVLERGSQEAAAEAAGALWNLAATLAIGERIGCTPGVIPALTRTLAPSNCLTARLQAVGALRNLAIVDANKYRIIAARATEALVQICCDRAALLGDSGVETVLPPANGQQSSITGSRRSRGGRGGGRGRARAQQAAEASAAPRNLGSLASAEYTQLTIKAGATLRILASLPQVQVECGSGPLLAALVRLAHLDPDASVVRQACGIILALSFCPGNRSNLIQAGAIPALLAQLGPMAAMAHHAHGESCLVSCAGALWNFASKNASEWTGTDLARGIAMLVRLLDSPRIEVVSRAAGALRCLAAQEPNRGLIVAWRGLPKLLRCIAQGQAIAQCLGTLYLIATSSDFANRRAILSSGALPVLAVVMRTREDENLQFAVSTLAALSGVASLDMADCVSRSDLFRLLHWSKGANAAAVRHDAARIAQILTWSQLPHAHDQPTSPCSPALDRLPLQ